MAFFLHVYNASVMEITNDVGNRRDLVYLSIYCKNHKGLDF